jgi:hypothetical protein
MLKISKNPKKTHKKLKKNPKKPIKVQRKLKKKVPAYSTFLFLVWKTQFVKNCWL